MNKTNIDILLHHRLWKPDVLLYNSASQEFDTTYEVNVNVHNNGLCKYGPPAIFESTCKVRSIRSITMIDMVMIEDIFCKINFFLVFKLDLRLTLNGFRLMYKNVFSCLEAGHIITLALT